MNEIAKPLLGTAADIARTLKRSPHGVRQAIARLKIEPIQTINRIPVYPMECTVERLRSEMRAQNKTQNPSAASHV